MVRVHALIIPRKHQLLWDRHNLPNISLITCCEPEPDGGNCLLVVVDKCRTVTWFSQHHLEVLVLTITRKLLHSADHADSNFFVYSRRNEFHESSNPTVAWILKHRQPAIRPTRTVVRLGASSALSTMTSQNNSPCAQDAGQLSIASPHILLLPFCVSSV